MRYTEFAKKFVAGLLERTKGTEFEKVQKEILAQWILESDHFRSPLATKHCNVGGIKAGRGYPKPHGEVEYTDWQGKTDKYCALSTPEEFADLYFWFLSRNSRYLKALDYIRNPPASDDFVGDNYIYLLSIDGYCTDIANPVTNLEELYKLAIGLQVLFSQQKYFKLVVSKSGLMSFLRLPKNMRMRSNQDLGYG